MKNSNASIWLKAETDEWQNRPLDHPAIRLIGKPGAEPRVEAVDTQSCSTTEIRRCEVNGEWRWAVLAPAGANVWVNGHPLCQFQMLHHRDCVWLHDFGPLHFSTERRITIEPFPAGNGDVFCVRCKLPMEVGKPACQCPGCGLWHHEDETEQRPCFTFGEKCAGCNDFPTDPDAGFRWMPESL